MTAWRSWYLNTKIHVLHFGGPGTGFESPTPRPGGWHHHFKFESRSGCCWAAASASRFPPPRCGTAAGSSSQAAPSSHSSDDARPEGSLFFECHHRIMQYGNASAGACCSQSAAGLFKFAQCAKNAGTFKSGTRRKTPSRTSGPGFRALSLAPLAVLRLAQLASRSHCIPLMSHGHIREGGIERLSVSARSTLKSSLSLPWPRRSARQWSLGRQIDKRP